MLYPMFGSIFLAGFECSTQRRWDRERLDMLEATRHFELCERDYGLAKRYAMQGARDGFRWHLIGARRGSYDWSSIEPMLKAAKSQGVSVIWDLCHYGYPDWLDIWSEDFVEEFAKFSAEAVRLIRNETGRRPMICPVNEISFWSWLGGKEGKINPFAIDRPDDLKRQLVRATIASVRAAKAVDPQTVVINAEPLIHVVRDTNSEEDIVAAAAYHNSQFHAADLILGKSEPELEGATDLLNVIGVNFYPHNQWRLRGGFVPLGHHDYRPLSKLLEEVWERYRKPILIAETGCEGSARPAWMSYVCSEIRTAAEAGIPIYGICIYPITGYSGWDNGRLCETGLFCEPDEIGNRAVNTPFREELDRQADLFRKAMGQRMVSAA